MNRNPYTAFEVLVQLDNELLRRHLLDQQIRELVPWDHRPPAVDDPQELLPFARSYQRRGRVWRVACCASPGRIDTTSSDWTRFREDLETDYRGEIGLFVTLGEVSPAVVAEAAELNRKSMHSLLLARPTWCDLAKDPIGMDDFLDYAVQRAKSHSTPVPLSVKATRQWIAQRCTAEQLVGDSCQQASAVFLRRHQLPHHAELYVRRNLDQHVEMAVRALKPSKLHRTMRPRWIRPRKGHEGHQIEWKRSMPPQAMVVRDLSGAGKTTLSVQLATSGAEHFGVVRAAVQGKLDDLSWCGGYTTPEIFRPSLEVFQSLVAADRPLLYIVDSLDEAQGDGRALQEVGALFRQIPTLNAFAQRQGYLGFPILMLFTVRDDYWDRWLTAFEGRNVIQHQKVISRFSDEQVREALGKYAHCYGYSLLGHPRREALDILSVPFNLQVFSEAHARQGPLNLHEVLTQNVLGRYFERKREDIGRRGIPGLGAKALMALCTRIALAMVEASTQQLSRYGLLRIITEAAAVPRGMEEDTLFALVSEQILVRQADGSTESFALRHSRFTEYLVAYHAVLTIDATGKTEGLDAVMTAVERVPTISIFRVNEAVRFICDFDYPQLTGLVGDYYASSRGYMRQSLLRIRAELGAGRSTDQFDIASIYRASNSNDPDLAVESFMVLAARHNQQPVERLVDSFGVAWQSATGRPDRWRVLTKAARAGILLQGEVVQTLADDASAKEWEVFLGFALEGCHSATAVAALRDLDGVVESVRGNPDPEWAQVRGLLCLLMENHPYVPGVVFGG
ncbi:hypothetical protein [Streptomyces sp. NPDC020362]|uniref:hypothetical protein n=1 Tax=unclassified Streptomyces TaxID=2593676 RepID=UPI0033F7A7A3